MTVTSKLILWKGYQSGYSLGLSTSIPWADPIPESIDLLNGTFTVSQVGGSSSWTPTIAVPKAGLWGDSATMDGRVPVAQPIANATEEMELTTTNRAAAWSALSTLNRFAQAAREYWEGVSPDPVMIEWQAVGAPGSQWAVIYSMDVSFSEVEVLIDDALTEVVSITLAFEREPAWRPIAPGETAARFVLESQGLLPTSTNPAPTGYYNIDSLGASTISASTRHGQELQTTFSNRIVIPANLIPGDAPALVEIEREPLSGVSTGWIYVTAESDTDYNPTNNFSPAASQRRICFNGGDATTTNATNITITKPIVPDGFISNGSPTNRHVARIVYAGAVGTPGVIEWSYAAGQLSHGAFAVFMRATATSGVASDAGVTVSVRFGSTNLATLPTYRLNTSIAAYRAGLHFLGTINISKRPGVISVRRPRFDGTWIIRMEWSRPGSANPTIELWDCILMPIPFVAIPVTTLGVGMSYSNTGFIDMRSLHVNFSGTGVSSVIGQPITLQPKKENRIFVIEENLSGTFDPTTQRTLSVRVLPRWYGVRDV